MNMRTAAALGAAAMVVGQPIVAQPNTDDYEHALGLRSAWSGLTENIAEPAQWIDGTHHFVYRKTVPGGFQFVVMDAETRQKQPAFDHERLATALGTATGQVTGQVAVQILQFCEQPRKAGEIQTLVGVKHRQTFRENYLNAIIGKGWLGRTIPDKPQSRLQRYQITAEGKKWLQSVTIRTPTA